MLEKDIYITRSTGSFLQMRGLQGVLIWMHEPCLEVNVRLDVFESDDKKIKKELDSLLYGKNSMYSFLYRSENDRDSEFGDKLIRNVDGIDIPDRLIELEEERKVQFYHSVLGGGRKTGYRPMNAGDFFGYDSEEAHTIWKMICDEYKDIPYNEWDKYEKEIPWFRFCKKLKIKIELYV